MNIKFLIIMTTISSLFYLVTQMAPVQMQWLYELSYYGSLPWSYPWFVEPYMACLDECGSKARYVGFVINAVILALLIKAGINKLKNNQAETAQKKAP